MPSFSSDIFSYQVTLNFAMDVFEVPLGEGQSLESIDVKSRPQSVVSWIETARRLKKQRRTARHLERQTMGELLAIV